jgi:TPR repeat protein
MNFFNRIIIISIFALTLFSAGLILQEALRMYQNNTLKNHPKAIQSLIDAANNNNSDAAFLLATSYKDGKIGAVTLQKAYKWYLKAAELGDGDAMLMLGWLYYKGELFGGSNIKKAKQWFSKAADKGIDEAIEMLEILNS